MEKKFNILLLFMLTISSVIGQKKNYIGLGINKPFQTLSNLGIYYTRDSVFNRPIAIKTCINFDFKNKNNLSNKNIVKGFDIGILYSYNIPKIKTQLLVGPAIYFNINKQTNLSNSQILWENKSKFFGAGLKLNFNRRIFKTIYVNIEFDLFYGKSEEIDIGITNSFKYTNTKNAFAYSKIISPSLNFKF